MTFHKRDGALHPLILALVVLLVAGSANAQQAGRGAQFPAAQRASQLLDRMSRTLGDVAASEEQHKKIDPILDDARKRFGDLAQSLIPEPPIVRRQRLVDFLEDVQDKITPNLSKEQADSFREKVGDFRQELIGNFVARGGRGANAPASQPAMGEPAQPERLGTVVERLRDYLNQVDLSDSQKNEVDTLFADTRKKLQAIEQGQDDVPQQQVVQELRQELAAILTPQQMDRLRTAVNQNPIGGFQGGRRGGGQVEMVPPPNRAVPEPAPPAAAAEPEIPMIDVGQPAPDFSLKRLDGNVAQLSQLKGRAVLIVFGSYSSPSFRQRAAALEKINRDFASRLVTFVIYTRENDPVGDWNVDRNKDDNISVEQPTDMNGRIVLARQARASLKMTTPFLMDNMDDATAKAYGGFTNAACLIGRDGNVAARQKWFEPYAMRADIEDALK